MKYFSVNVEQSGFIASYFTKDPGVRSPLVVGDQKACLRSAVTFNRTSGKLFKTTANAENVPCKEESGNYTQINPIQILPKNFLRDLQRK